MKKLKLILVSFFFILINLNSSFSLSNKILEKKFSKESDTKAMLVDYIPIIWQQPRNSISTFNGDMGTLIGEH